MLTYPQIDPVAVSLPRFEILDFAIGPLSVHWYGLMYLFAFSFAWMLGMYRAKKAHSPVAPGQVEDLVFYGALGIVLGARMGYVVLYNFEAFLEDPLWLFRVWEGGMSFHGGMIGVLIAMSMYCKKINRNFIDVMDFVAPLVPIGLGLGRIGNFIGQELWGRETTVSWGMVFPNDPDALVRHPSQLYQSFFEGFILFAVLFWFSGKPRPRAAVGALFLTLYGCFRFGIEFFRQPDAHIGYEAFGWMTRGQEYSLPMIIIGAVIFAWSYYYDSKKNMGTAKS